LQQLYYKGVALLVLGRNFVVKPLFCIEIVHGFQVGNLVELFSFFQKKAAGGLGADSDIDTFLVVQFFVGIMMMFEELQHEGFILFHESPERLLLVRVDRRLLQNRAQVSDQGLFGVERVVFDLNLLILDGVAVIKKKRDLLRGEVGKEDFKYERKVGLGITDETERQFLIFL